MINKVKRPYYVGVDWAKGKWLAFTLNEDGNGFAEEFPDIESLWNKHKDAELILIDIPIGLPSKNNKSRLCDIKAREYVAQRKSSVFPVPCREVYKANNWEEAYAIRGLSKQTWGITHLIREVDVFLHSNARARKIIKEIHPEVCFTALNYGKPLEFSKSKTGERQKGLEERKRVLYRYCDVDNLFTQARNKFPLKKDAGDDDILDALVAAVTALKGFGRLKTLPENPEYDSEGLPMQITYFNPTPPPPLLAPGSR